MNTYSDLKKMELIMNSDELILQFIYDQVHTSLIAV